MIGKIKDTLTVKYLCVKERVKSHFVNLWKREDGMGVVEVIVVLIALVIIFKKQISGLVSSILSKMSNQANQV